MSEKTATTGTPRGVDVRQQRYDERRQELLSRAKWWMMGTDTSGAAIIEAWIDGEPVYRYRGYYREREGDWRLYTMCILKRGCEPLAGVRAVSIYAVHRKSDQ